MVSWCYYWLAQHICERADYWSYASDASHAPRASRVAHHVAYDDGDDQWHHLEANSKDPDSVGFRWLDAHTPVPQGGSSRDPVKRVFLLDSDDEEAAAGKTTTVFLLDSDDEEDGKAAASNTTTVGGETEWQW